MSFHALSRVLTLLALLFLAGCAAQQPLQVPGEIHQYAGETRDDHWVNTDGMNLYGQYWLPTGDPLAVVLLLHGTTMHSGLYDEFARFLASRGYAVYGTDLQGWGRSEGIGARGDVYNADKYVTDVAMVSERLRAEFPGIPMVAFGESLGAVVALLGITERRLHFDGLVFSSPGYRPNPGFLGIRGPQFAGEWMMGMASWWGNTCPKCPLIESDIGLRFIIEDDEMQRRMLDDPYVSHNFLPARYVTALWEANKFIIERAEMVTVPMLVIHGDQDELIPLASAQELVSRALSRDKTLSVYEGMGHAAMIQRERYRAMKEIRDWLDRRLPR
jgi:acylglycerol lipase